ncbi:MAG: hypothetical protein CSA29_04985 [Desulfobacterales bacterium]|nr:MAG: hypothetical protein CSA29_04985 [Desulfobacterales bacterium]
MRKENVLVAVLVAIIIGGIYTYNAKQTTPVMPPDHPRVDTGPGGFDGVATAHAETLDSAGIQWNEYTTGMARAKQEKKDLFVYFYAPWCSYCNMLKRTTFTDKRIQSYLNENFISISVNTDEKQALSKKYGIRGLPTMWFLEPDSKKISSLPGYVEPDQLLKILEYIHTKSYTTMEFKDFVKNRS